MDGGCSEAVMSGQYRHTTYLREVAHYVEAFGVVLCHYVEEERVCVVIQGFVVQETLSE